MDSYELSNSLKEEKIRKAILAQDKTIRKKYPFFEYQTTIGFSLWLGSMLWVVGNAWAYMNGSVSWYLAVPIAALPLSILHEVEHDIIHKQYFPSNKGMRDIMLGFIWIFKCAQEMSPFVRYDLHLLHHKRSGQIDDIEERLIGLGIQSNTLRFLTAFLPGLGIIYVYSPGWGIESTTFWRFIRGSSWWSMERLSFLLDVFLLGLPLTLGFLAFMGDEWAQTLMVVWVGPNILRHACLVIMSSYSHYYLAEDEASAGDVTLQNQILNHWSLLPFQLFCFNFGAEHIIHHYFISQPFYIRHLCRGEAWKVMEENGVRINDFGTITRANRRHKIEGKMA